MQLKLLYVAILVLFSKQHTVLNIEIIGIKQIQGSVLIAVYDDPDTFLSEEVVAGDSFEVLADTMMAQMRLPHGEYAISVFHDQNSDGELNTNIFGIPKEPVGFSNDAKGSFGPPDFHKALVDCSQDQQKIKITLVKPGI